MAEERAFGLPLLAKELIEQSARLRTYVLRSSYAILLFGFATLIFWGEVYSNISNPMAILGEGRELFQILMALQIGGIALFTPAITCGAITVEKERNTFGLLLLTRLGPWTILTEKFLGRVFVMGTYLLISLPLFGFCYSLGGIEQKQVWFGFYGLIVMVLQLAALGLFCSTYFRTTVSAFIATYLIGLLMVFGPTFLIEVFRLDSVNWFAGSIWYGVDRTFLGLASFGKSAAIGLSSIFGVESQKLFERMMADLSTNFGQIGLNERMRNSLLFFCPPLIMEATDNTRVAIPSWQVISMGVPSLASSVFFLLLARLFIVRRAFLTPKRYLVMFFQMLDGLFQRANENRFTRGIVLVGERSKLPVYDPVAWRETTKTSLGSFRYLIRIFLALEFPVIAISVLAIATANSDYYRDRHGAISFIVMLCWVIALLLTIVRSATLVSGERSHETLDVLLTTPITSKQFMSQKFRGVIRLMIVVSLPLVTAMIMQCWYALVSHGNNISDDSARYLFVGVVSAVVCLPMFAWISFFMGMWIKSTTKAIFASLGLVVGWMIIPPVISIAIFEAFNVGPGDTLATLLVISPLIVPFFNEIDELNDISQNEWVAILLHFFICGGVLAGVRYLCIKNGARLLGRSEDDWS